MNRRQFFYLFAGNFIIVNVGMGLFPILPLYAAEFGATTGVVGIYMAIIYLAITAGTMLTDRFTKRLSESGTFVAAFTVGIPALILLGQATTFWQVVLLTAVVWFTGGVGLAVISVVTGIIADADSRGRLFSVLSLTGPLGALIGGMTVSRLVSTYDYPLTFAALGITWFLLPVLGRVGMRVQRSSSTSTAMRQKDAAAPAAPLGRTYYLLLAGSLLSAIAINVGRLGTSLSMQVLQFSPSDVASTATISGLIAVPVVYAVGALSDGRGRKQFLVIAYVLAAVGTVALGVSSALWHFWAASALLLISMTVGGAVASAFVTDLLPADALNRGLPWLNSAGLVAGTVSFVGAGYALEVLGAMTLYVVAGAVSLVAALLTQTLSEERVDVGPSGEPLRPIYHRSALCEQLTPVA